MKADTTRRGADSLVNVDSGAALDMYAQRGEWDECIKQAAKQSQSTLNKYLAQYATSLITQGTCEESICS